MPRQKNDNLHRYNVLLDPTEVMEAQLAAIKYCNVEPKTAGNLSAFLRLLLRQLAERLDDADNGG